MTTISPAGRAAARRSLEALALGDAFGERWSLSRSSPRIPRIATARSKPPKYAAAGIVHFWRVEESDGLPVVFVYELDPMTHTYLPIDVFRKRMKIDLPFPIDIDPTAVNRRRPASS